MTLLIRNYDEYDDVRYFDPDSLSVSHGGNRSDRPKVRGLFIYYQGDFFCVFRTDALYLTINGDTYPINEKSQSVHITPDNKSDSQLVTFRLYVDGRMVFDLSYTPSTEYSWRLEHDFVTSFFSEEDFDFFLFLHNLLRDTDGQKILLSM